MAYTNGASAQGLFQLQAIYHPVNIIPGQVQLSESVTTDDHATLVRSVIAGQTTGGGGGFVNVKVNPSGAISADVTQATSPWVVSGTAVVSGTVAVSGTVTTNGSGYTQPISGTVAVSGVSGTVTVNASGATVPVSGTVAVSGTTTVSGTVAVSAVSGTVNVSGGVTANIGTSGALALDATLTSVRGTVAPGAAATNSVLTGGVYVSTKPALTTGQQAALRLDANGCVVVTSDSSTLATDTFTFTSATPAQARPVAGDMYVGETLAKTVIVKNTGANSARITVYASVDNGTNYDTVLSNNTLLASGNTLEVNTANAYTNIRVFAASNTGGQSNTVVSRGYAMGS